MTETISNEVSVSLSRLADSSYKAGESKERARVATKLASSVHAENCGMCERCQLLVELMNWLVQPVVADPASIPECLCAVCYNNPGQRCSVCIEAESACQEVSK